MRIIFITPVANDTRINKRVDEMRNRGANVIVLSFERKHYSNSIDKNFIPLGMIEHKNYFLRIFKLFNSISLIRNNIESDDIVYSFELDNLLLGYIGSMGKNNIKLIYEVADIRSILLGNNILSRSIRLLQRYLLSKIFLLVVTSQRYLSGYFKSILGVEIKNSFTLENKPIIEKKKRHTKEFKGDEDGIIKIGYFGVFRCQWSWDLLTQIARDYPSKIIIYVRGINHDIENFDSNVKEYDNIIYDGTYSKSDIRDIYESVDVVWAGYPKMKGDLGNWKWARTNRFYEAAFFNKPMFTRKGTEDNDVAKKYGVSIEIDYNDLQGSKDKIRNLKRIDLTVLDRAYVRMPKKIYTVSDEYDELYQSLNS